MGDGPPPIPPFWGMGIEGGGQGVPPPPGATTAMGSRLEYLVRSKNRVVVHYACDAAGGGATFPMDASVFGPTAWGEYTTTGLTHNSAAISRIVYGAAGTTGDIDLIFLGATGFTAFALPCGAGDFNFERMTIPNLAQGSTGLFAIQNNLGAANKSATVMIEFVTTHR